MLVLWGVEDRAVTAPGSSQVAAPAVVDTTTTPATMTPATTAPEPTGEITLVFGGDLLAHLPVDASAARYGALSGRPYDFRPMFAPIAGILADADLAICHMEVPLAPDGEPPSGYPSFGAPPELVVDAGASGYDGCSTASNHSLDRGLAGLDRLLGTFDLAGMGHVGTGRSPGEGDGHAWFYDVDGVHVAHLSFSYGFNGVPIPEDAPWSVNPIDPGRIVQRAGEARAAGADLVVVSMHWGDEYAHDPNPQQEAWADQILASDAIDVVIGHHAHVVQPVSRVAGRFVVWGLGNQLSNQSEPDRRDGLLVRLHATTDPEGVWSVDAIDAIPTYVDLDTHRILPVVQTLDSDDLDPQTRLELTGSYLRTAEVLARRPTQGVHLEPLAQPVAPPEPRSGSAAAGVPPLP